MRITPSRRSLLTSAVILGLALLGGCISEPTGVVGGPLQTAAANASPLSATVTSGGSATVTVAFTATGGLVIGPPFQITKPFEGITVERDSLMTTGSTTTAVYTVTADATVPAGTHEVRFHTAVFGYSGQGNAPSAFTTFWLTVQ